MDARDVEARDSLILRLLQLLLSLPRYKTSCGAGGEDYCCCGGAGFVVCGAVVGVDATANSGSIGK